MMDEMAKTLARRRAAAEKQDVPSNIQDDTAERKSCANGKLNGSNSSALLVPSSGDSPLGSRKRSGSSGEESTMRVNAVDNSADLDLLKQELLHEIRKEMNKVKQEIIEVIRQELSRR